MRTRSLSILATTALAALLGCPIEGLKTPDARVSSESGSVAGDSESHDDAVDAAEDISWASAELPAGKSALRVLMTDAPVEADSVFVTFCGIFVQASGADVGADPGVAGGPRGDVGAGGSSGGRDSGAAGAPDAPSRAGAGGDGAAAPRPEGAGGDGAGDDGAGGDGAVPTPDQFDGEATDAEREAAERTEAERMEAERARIEAERERMEAERERIEAEREAADGSGAGGSSGTDAAPPRGDGSEGWQLVSQECQTLDLLTLRDGVTEAVGVATLPPGHYGQIRLMLVDASIVVDGVEHDLTVPSGMESGLKIQGGFELLDGGATTVTLDFDAGQSVHYTEGSGYRLAPVINVIDVISHDDGAEPRDPARPSADPGTARPSEGGAGGAGSGGAGGDGAGGASVPPPPPPPRPELPGADEPPPPPPPPQPEPPKAGDEPRPEEPPPAAEPPPAPDAEG